MTKFWLMAAIAGLAGGAAWLMVGTGILFGLVLSYLAPTPLFMAGLGLGSAGGIAAGIAAALLVLVAAGLPDATVYAVMVAGPSALLIRQVMLSREIAAADGGESDDDGAAAGATEWYPPGLLAAWLAAIGIVILSVLALFLLSRGDGIEAAVVAVIEEFASAVELPDPELFAAVVTPLLPGLMVAGWMMMLMLNGALAQTILVRARRNLRPTLDIAALVLPGWIAPAGAVAAVVGLMAPGDFGYFGRNMVAVLAVPFFLQGLAVVHALARRNASGRPLLAVFYVLLIVVGWLAVPVAILGLAEQMAGIRARLEKNPPS